MGYEYVAANLQEVREQIDDAARRCGRSPDDVVLMGVCKNHPYEAVEAAHAAGLGLFGENRAQEAIGKHPAPPRDYDLHFIGTFQRNKAKVIAPFFDAVQSIDRLEAAQALAARTSTDRVDPMPILLEYNTSMEASKSGFLKHDALLAAIEGILQLETLAIRGLMTLGPLNGDERETRAAFARLSSLGETVRTRFPELPLPILSMGMSGDFPWAIAEGSTLVRVGTAIFGARR